MTIAYSVFKIVFSCVTLLLLVVWSVLYVLQLALHHFVKRDSINKLLLLQQQDTKLVTYSSDINVVYGYGAAGRLD